ncbi:helix-turn-helix domain-containing protein [Citrobacter sp. MGH109]|uniref:helix-turn-helix domain-containing protein n=1 Tax=Citrobacter sp. MGH109 TaxID=1686382 RepID=UPI0006510639|nr:helix-turn-helix transcriptional regulator [Citrobacter sp. MGH109]KLV82827.1 hypothetical protein SK37_02236 [Citrobacter sp. MGH109]
MSTNNIRLIKDYIPPTPNDLIRLKEQLGYTGTQMADLGGVSSNSQWRKYTSGGSPRSMSPHILFFIAAQLALSKDDLTRVLDKMREIGGEVK